MIRKFINENLITFDEGRRNSSLVILIGYCLHLKLNQNDLIAELEIEIENDCWLEEEIERLWNYCKSHNYADYWTKDIAKQTYKF